LEQDTAALSVVITLASTKLEKAKQAEKVDAAHA
jgi:hypothetical protein